MKTYKVWIVVEVHDDRTDDYVNLTENEAADFTGRGAQAKAEELAAKLLDFGLNITGIHAQEISTEEKCAS